MNLLGKKENKMSDLILVPLVVIGFWVAVKVLSLFEVNHD